MNPRVHRAAWAAATHGELAAWLAREQVHIELGEAWARFARGEPEPARPLFEAVARAPAWVELVVSTRSLAPARRSVRASVLIHSRIVAGVTWASCSTVSRALSSLSLRGKHGRTKGGRQCQRDVAFHRSEPQRELGLRYWRWAERVSLAGKPATDARPSELRGRVS